MGVSPTRQPLQPEAIGAVTEVTKWLKPSISVSRIGDSASVQAGVNAEQSSKTTMRRPTRQPFRGEETERCRMAQATAPLFDSTIHVIAVAGQNRRLSVVVQSRPKWCKEVVPVV